LRPDSSRFLLLLKLFFNPRKLRELFGIGLPGLGDAAVFRRIELSSNP
jgi:hypothetical protein